MCVCKVISCPHVHSERGEQVTQACVIFFSFLLSCDDKKMKINSFICASQPFLVCAELKNRIVHFANGDVFERHNVWFSVDETAGLLHVACMHHVARNGHLDMKKMKIAEKNEMG